MRSAILPGVIFPDYELSDHTAKRRRLSELQGQHPMVLVLSRGGFCPKDHRQAEGLVQLYREIEAGARWPFLSDAGRVVQRDLDIAEYTEPIQDLRAVTRKCRPDWDITTLKLQENRIRPASPGTPVGAM